MLPPRILPRLSTTKQSLLASYHAHIPVVISWCRIEECREQIIPLRRRMCCGGRRGMLATEKRRSRPGAVVRNPWQGVAPDSWAVGTIQPDDSSAAGLSATRSAQTSRSNGVPRFFGEARATSAPAECLSKRSTPCGWPPPPPPDCPPSAPCTSLVSL